MRRGALLAGSLIVACLSTASAQQTPRPEERINRDPMIAFVAIGPPNSCGLGCNRWIAVEGNFNRGSAKRLRDFLDQRTNLQLPIFIHSMGGLVDEAINIGRLLREHRKSAGVGRSVLQICGGYPTASDCLRLVGNSQDLIARLRPGEGICASACVYALAGASRREIDRQARIGIHAAQPVDLGQGAKAAVDPSKSAADARASQDRIRRGLLRYVTDMGVDPGLVDLAFRVDPSSIRFLSRTELNRFGLASKDYYETPWMGVDESPNAYTLSKTISRRTPPTDEQLTTTLGLTCRRTEGMTMLNAVNIYVRRERAQNEPRVGPRIRVKADDTEVWSSVSGHPQSTSLEDFYGQILPLDQVLKSVPKRSLEYSETFEKPWAEGQWAEHSNTIKLSIEGLEAALMTMRRHCERIHGTGTQPARLDR